MLRFRTMAVDDAQENVILTLLRRDEKKTDLDPRIKTEVEWLYDFIIRRDGNQQQIATFLVDAAISHYIPIAQWAQNIIQICALVTPGSVFDPSAPAEPSRNRPIIKVSPAKG